MSEVSTTSSTSNCCTLHPSSLEFFAVSQAGLVRRFCHGSKQVLVSLTTLSTGTVSAVSCATDFLAFGWCMARICPCRPGVGCKLTLQVHIDPLARRQAMELAMQLGVPEKCDQVAFEYMNRVMIWIRSQLSALSQRVPLRTISFPDFLGGTVFPSFF